jgi:hypothetical protein
MHEFSSDIRVDSKYAEGSSHVLALLSLAYIVETFDPNPTSSSQEKLFWTQGVSNLRKKINFEKPL